MSESHETTTTEAIDGETWCSECKKGVEEWKVVFETGVDSDRGYDKVRRCPHCNAKCFADSGSGCVYFGLFFVGMICSALLCEFAIRHGVDIDRDSDAYGWILFVGCILLGLVFCFLEDSLRKWITFRDRPALSDGGDREE
jgi:DNA-directed RNA polymerase subunit RPC12/RpoP